MSFADGSPLKKKVKEKIECFIRLNDKNKSKTLSFPREKKLEKMSNAFEIVQKALE